MFGFSFSLAWAAVRAFFKPWVPFILGATFGLMAIGLAWQTVRIHGLQIDLPFIGAVGPQGLIAERDAALAAQKAAEQSLADFRAANVEATRKAKEARDNEQARLDKLTKEANDAIEKSRSVERDRAERFIAAGGVRQNRGSAGSGRSVAPGQGDSAGSGEGVHQAPELAPAEPMQIVGVTASDVRICTDNTVLAEQFRSFILDLEKGQESLP